MNQRTIEILDDVAANKNGSKKLTGKIISILNAIKDALPSEHKKLLEELEDIRGKRELITYKTLYRQGLKDGARLGNVFHGFK